MAGCYILYSKQLGKYYTGSTTETISTRIEKHLLEFYDGFHFTHNTKDWTLFCTIPCSDINQARKIERHIKNMKSKKYIENLKKYPEVIKKLLNKYS